MSCVTSGRLTLCMTQHGLLRFRLVFFCFAYVIRPGTTSSHTTMEAQLLNICERKKLYLLSFGSRKEQEFLIHKTKKYENDDIAVHFLRQCSARIPVVDGVWASAGHRDVSVSTCHFRTC